MTSRVRAATAGATLLALLGLGGLAGCSSSDHSSSGGSSHSAPAAGVPAPEDGGAVDSDALRVADNSGVAGADIPKADYAAEATDPTADPALIKRATIGLTSDDVDGARLSARKIIDTHAGTIDSEETSTDDAGDVSTVRMVIRVPAADFDQVVEDLKKVAHLDDASTSSTDVRDRVIHTHVQIGVQRDAIARIRQLLSRATNIGDIIRIEGELTDRVARLETLQRTAAYLADQTSMSTINLYIEKVSHHATPPEEKKRTGFVGGLDRGWDAFTTSAGWLAGAVGTLLPFAVALAVVGLPLGWVLRRRFRTGRPVKPAAG